MIHSALIHLTAVPLCSYHRTSFPRDNTIIPGRRRNTVSEGGGAATLLPPPAGSPSNSPMLRFGSPRALESMMIIYIFKYIRSTLLVCT